MQVEDGVPFKTFLQQGGDRLANYIELHPEPALMIESLDADVVSRPSTANEIESTDSFDLSVMDFSGSHLGETKHDEAMVSWLRKSQRNPFTGFITLGRAGNNDIVVQDSPMVSAIHLYFTLRGEQWYVEDKGTTNGTWLQGVRLRAREALQLTDGASLVVAGVTRARFFEPRSFWEYYTLLRAKQPNRGLTD